jgi:hypothetical protein
LVFLFCWDIVQVRSIFLLCLFVSILLLISENFYFFFVLGLLNLEVFFLFMKGKLLKNFLYIKRNYVV